MEYTYYLNINSGEEIKHEIKVKNTGAKTWKAGATFLETGPYLRSFSKFEHSSWLKYYCPAALKQDVGSGETAIFNVIFLGPQGISGDIQENYQIVIDGYPVNNSLSRIFFRINQKEKTEQKQPEIKSASINEKNTSQALENDAIVEKKPSTVKPEEKNTANNETPTKTASQPEFEERAYTDASGGVPIIRVGLYNTNYPQSAVYNRNYEIFAGKELIASGLKADEMVKVSYDANQGRYSITINGKATYASEPVRLIPRDNEAIATLVDFDSRINWRTYYNDNLFRGVIEFNYSKETGKFWVINELPINMYLKGIAETSNYSPFEFQKVLISAARTYAMYHYNRGRDYGIPDGSTKHAKEHFHVDALYDQVYRGYRSELRTPNLSRAVDETFGSAVTYGGKAVVTPYFSRSDGRTRAWEEVWYGAPKPWLVSVPVPEDLGQTLWGHGVGMSARGALIMARDKGMGWQEILKYFYRNSEILKIY